MQTTTYKLNVTPGGVPLTIHISQYDVGLRQYTFQPYTNVGEFTYVSGATVTLEATKPDGYGVVHECTYNQDGITYTLQEQLAAKPGRVWSKVVIRDGADVLGTGAVIWIVDCAGLKDDAIVSESDVSGIRGMIDAEVKRTMSESVISSLPNSNASGAVAHFTDGAYDIPVRDLKIGIVPKQSGSGDPSPSNIRPITGWTEATVTRTGKNLAKLTFGNQVPSITSGQMVSANGWSSDFIKVDSSKPYVFSSNGAATCYCLFYKSDGTYLDYYDSITTPKTIVASNYSRWNEVGKVKLRTDDSTSSAVFEAQFEVGTTPTAYEPYISETYPILFGIGETIYGGTLDVTTGVLTVEWVSADITSLDWAGTPSDYMYNSSYPTGLGKANGIINIYTDCYKTINVASVSQMTNYSIKGNSANANLYVKDDRYSTVSGWKTALSGHMICYELATPQTYQLNPTEVKTLLGTNNIWADTGDTDVEYKADTTLYIDSKLNATKSIIAGVEVEYKATKNYSIGNYVIVNDALYKVTSAIASGASITPGTNCTQTTVAEQLILLANA